MLTAGYNGLCNLTQVNKVCVCVYSMFWTTLDLYHTAAMLSLMRIKLKSFVFSQQASHWIRVWARLAVRRQSFLFPRNSTWPPSDKGLFWPVTFWQTWFELSRVKLYRKWPLEKWKLLQVSGKFRLSRVRVTGSKITVIVWRKSRANRIWFELAWGSS